MQRKNGNDKNGKLLTKIKRKSKLKCLSDEIASQSTTLSVDRLTKGKHKLLLFVTLCAFCCVHCSTAYSLFTEAQCLTLYTDIENENGKWARRHRFHLHNVMCLLCVCCAVLSCLWIQYVCPRLVNYRTIVPIYTYIWWQSLLIFSVAIITVSIYRYLSVLCETVIWVNRKW